MAKKAASQRRATARRSSAAASDKMVYYFGKTKTEGKKATKAVLGGKGKNLAEMTSIGLPVPPGFTITTEVCDAYYKAGKKLPNGLMDDVHKAVELLEKELKKSFGDDSNPLLVSVRSGAAVSMPGMMNTILNLGLNDVATEGLAKATKNERFAYDAYRRLINMYGDVVMGIEHEAFEEAFTKIKKKYKVTEDTEVPAEGLKELCDAYKAVYKKGCGEEFPQDPITQLQLAIEAVFGSWNADRAISYRRIEAAKGNTEIANLIGTAVNVQAMVYGNMGDDSGTGVGFTRDPNTGQNKFYGEFLVNAQGEDVVAGIRTPQPVSEMGKWDRKAHKELMEIKKTLEDHYTDMQDIEFTIEKGKLFMLQTRTGKRNGIAAVKIACDMVKEGLIDEKEAVRRVPASDLTHCLLPSFKPTARNAADVLCRGLNASPGAAVGKLAFTAEEARSRFEAGENVILVRRETSPEDVEGMSAAVGILTSTGGATSHAAVVARGWGKCCVAGAGDIHINEKAKKITVNGRTLTDKDTISLDGATGEVMAGEVETQEPKLAGDFAKLMTWADKYRTLNIRTNADSPADSKRARDFGAEGIGLCRTEHMFFEADRIIHMRAMILAETEDDRRAALKKLLPFQRKDFEGIFKAMKGLPVTVRLLDPPLHEFLPHDNSAQKEMASELGVKPAEIKKRAEALHESNPMLGHRGCRLSVTYPEILEMQVQAIVEAAINSAKKKIDAHPEIMIPLVGTSAELRILREKVEETIEATKAAKKFDGKLDIKIGTMIEIPRAALTADEVAEYADFFSFGTNDLTQMTFGYSRDDVGGFLPEYIENKILQIDPFQSIDQTGVGQLVSMGVEKGRSIKKNLKVGICGEHGGDPQSVRFCHEVGLDYVSCSPFRVPIARLAAAQAALG
ncbi:Pyruvate, phosphate dikinase [Crateriforma conspicua]|uniref:Pyruvate, phosphate dikinase n=2 Tax=Crateriforma conspicua TaxID=2527996 RepID=A0A5C5Y599_9PLAN|nr:pyruvate, phosphate dikinase [Crateriforma conspicua]QDV64692.1 Pyruvate, phosphate dikinase [Crateriforma conspicua]TWT70089.1 Pyruvate, phosphate dikinase [Crateriforma conspicua]